MAKYILCEHWKVKGRYPVDMEHVLHVSPYLSQALALAEKKKNERFSIKRCFAVVLSLFALCFFWWSDL